MGLKEMAEKQESTKEQKEKAREIALANLKGGITDLAVAYFVNRGKPYGEAGNKDLYEFVYNPAKSTKEGQKFIDNLWAASREDGELYTGNLTEHKIIKTAAGIVQSSIGDVKVDDLYELMGSKVSINETYKGKYLTDLAESKNDKIKEFIGTLLGGFQSYLIQSRMQKAVGERKKETVKDLEELVKVPEKSK
jgi:hypothetical protein